MSTYRPLPSLFVLFFSFVNGVTFLMSLLELRSSDHQSMCVCTTNYVFQTPYVHGSNCLRCSWSGEAAGYRTKVNEQRPYADVIHPSVYNVLRPFVRLLVEGTKHIPYVIPASTKKRACDLLCNVQATCPNYTLGVCSPLFASAY